MLATRNFQPVSHGKLTRMDEKDLEIARLKGQVEAYQEQLRSMAIELLRKQVKDLQSREERRDESVKVLHSAFGKLEAKVTERLAKASALFVELRKDVRAVETNGENSG